LTVWPWSLICDSTYLRSKSVPLSLLNLSISRWSLELLAVGSEMPWRVAICFSSSSRAFRPAAP
jgi:hypothetical protein